MFYFPFVFMVSLTNPAYVNPYLQAPIVPVVAVASIEAPATKYRAVANIEKKPLFKITRHKIPESKDLVTVMINCPTEKIGIATPTSWCLHKFLDNGFAVVNHTKFLPVDLQQVCG